MSLKALAHAVLQRDGSCDTRETSRLTGVRIAKQRETPENDVWIVSSGSNGAMRLMVGIDPGEWSDAVFRCAALLEVLDDRTRADRADAQDLADEIEALLAGLRRQGIPARWVS